MANGDRAEEIQRRKKKGRQKGRRMKESEEEKQSQTSAWPTPTMLQNPTRSEEARGGSIHTGLGCVQPQLSPGPGPGPGAVLTCMLLPACYFKSSHSSIQHSSTAPALTSECCGAPCGRQRYCSVRITVPPNSKPETKPRVFADAYRALNKCGCMGSRWGWRAVFPRTHMKSTSLCCPLSRHLHSSHSCPQLASPPSADPSPRCSSDLHYCVA